MKKVCFIYDEETNEQYLKILSKMTPKRSGIWKDMVGVPDIKDADWIVVIDKTSKDVPEDRTLYVSAHPYLPEYRGYVDLSEKKYKLDLKNTFGFGEWWLEYDYDYLSQLEPMEKIKDVCCIISDTGGNWGKDRRKEFAKTISSFVNVYGRIKDVGNGELGENTPEKYWFGKEKVLADHKYSVEIDVGLTKNYFSERVFDSLLMWCMPLYWGSTNVEEYLPKDCFRYIDIYGDGKDIQQIVEQGARYQSIESIAEARDLLLNKYQLWARVYDYICSL